ncbi:C40 family peptidase [Sporosarcina sp. CAU 1771]
MKKQLGIATLVICISLSSFGMNYPNQAQVSAATTTQTNQQAVELKAEQLIATAKSLIGKATYSNTEYKSTAPYKFSCATFLMYIFEKNGVDLATYNENYMMQQGTHVAKGQWQKGDLLFFRSKTTGTDPDHVAMYIGDNKVIQMADPTQKIVITDLSSKAYYTDTYVTARRVLPSLLSSNPATKGDNIVELSYSLMNKVTMGNKNNENTLNFTGAGFVNYVYKQNSVNLGTVDIKEQMKKGSTVSQSNLRKGDLLFFSSAKGSLNPSLVAIYAGDHRIIVPTSGGILTRVLLVDYYKDRFITAKRVYSEPTTQNVVPPVTNSSQADKTVNFASSLIGKAKFGYTYDEKSLTFTGAGFTYYIYKNQGIDLKYKLASRQAQMGKAVQKASLQKGDLIFFSTNNKGTQITQTGIYIGGNQFISLSTAGPVVQESLNTAWAKSNYVTARRVF